MAYITPSLVTLLGLLTVGGLFGYLNFGKVSSIIVRLFKKYLSAVGVHHGSQTTTREDDLQVDENLVLDKYQH
jgi:hypothetical protein